MLRVYYSPEEGARGPLQPVQPAVVGGQRYDAPIPREFLTPNGDSWGDASVLEQAGAFVGAYTSAGDARVKIEKLKAQIQNLQSLKRQFPFLAAIVYDPQINKIQAEIRALEQVAAETQQTESAKLRYLELGQVGLGVGIVGGVLAASILGLIAYRLASKK